MNQAADVEEVLRMVGLKLESTKLIGSGSWSEVWIADTSAGRVVVRFLRPKNGTMPRMVFETALRRKLHQDGIRVAKPVATSRDFPQRVHQKPWIIDDYLAGDTYPRGEIPKRACVDLANVLSHLHNIEGLGFGLPHDSAEFKGTEDTIQYGLTTRFDNPWPFGVLSLDEHPISEAGNKPVLDRLNNLRPELESELQDSLSRVVHTDLHEGHIICTGEQLSGLIDFGDAMIGDPAWDFASLYYFHGERVLNTVLGAYESNGISGSTLRHRATLFSACIACHHAMRSKRLNKPHRMSAALAHLEKSLEH